MAKANDQHILNYLLRLGDDRLVLGQRVSEWCGHGPILEEDIALSNIALDLIGQASAFYKLCGKVEGKGNTEDFFAYHRGEREFLNLKLVEQPRGDFAVTIARQFLFDAFQSLFLPELSKSSHSGLSALAAKSEKETRYHLRHSHQWVLRLGDGTEESHARIQAAFDDLWMYTGEFFEMNETDLALIKDKATPDLNLFKRPWEEIVSKALKDAKLKVPTSVWMTSGCRSGLHTEHLGHLLSELQILPRSFPGASW